MRFHHSHIKAEGGMFAIARKGFENEEIIQRAVGRSSMSTTDLAVPGTPCIMKRLLSISTELLKISNMK